MNKVVRGALFWLFFLTFVIAAPLTVLYTAGFRYNAKNNSLVRTGVISVSSTPRNAEIFLNNETTERTTPYLLKRNLPGTYRVDIKRTGFHPWSGDVEVRSGETTNILNILLYLSTEPRQEFVRTASSVTPSPIGDRAAYTIEEGGWEEIWLFHANQQVPQLVDRVSIDETSEGTRLVWSADASRLLAQSMPSGDVRLYTNAGTEIITPQELFDDHTELFWHPTAGNILFVATESELRQHDFTAQTTQILENDDAASVLIDNTVLTFFDNGSATELHRVVGEARELIAVLPRGIYTILERDGSYLLIQDTRNMLTLLNINAGRPILLETYAEVYDWDANADRLVFSDGIEISVYSPASHATEFITRQSEFIETLAWHAGGTRILIGTKTRLSAVETHRLTERRHTINLLDAQEIEIIWTSRDEKTIYFYGTIDGATGFYALPVLR